MTDFSAFAESFFSKANVWGMRRSVFYWLGSMENKLNENKCRMLLKTRFFFLNSSPHKLIRLKFKWLPHFSIRIITFPSSSLSGFCFVKTLGWQFSDVLPNPSSCSYWATKDWNLKTKPLRVKGYRKFHIQFHTLTLTDYTHWTSRHFVIGYLINC